MMKDRIDDIIGEDFQGWPIFKMNLREMLIGLGFKEKKYKSGKVHFIAPNNDILDEYPVTLEDDGMGYGVNEQYITEVQNNQETSCPYALIFMLDSYDEKRANKLIKELKKYDTGGEE